MTAPSRFVVAVALSALLATSCSLPSLKQVQATAPALEQTSYLYDADKHLITQFHDEQNREIVKLKRIPVHVQNAVIAIEDRRFWEHPGVDVRAILRAAAANAEAGAIVQGGSTITEQYIKQTLLSPEQTLSRKFNEAVLAWQMEETYSKEEILEGYLNTVYFGEGAYGVQAAAERYFSKPAERLSLGQGAMLAGLISSPNNYDPIDHRKKAVARRNLVLQEMYEQGMITKQQLENASDGGLGLRPAPEKLEEYPAPYFVDYVKKWFLAQPRFGTLEERIDLLFSGGLRIYTTLDLKMQRFADRAVNSVLRMRNDPYGAMTVVDPRTGHIKAMVGGRDFFARHDNLSQLNLATGGSTGRQAGSSFKPFILVAALEQGIKPSKTYPAPSCINIRSKKWLSKPWRVCNADLGSYGGSMSLAAATAGSVNTYFAQLMMDVGPDKAVKVAEDMGIRCCTDATEPTTPLLDVPSAVLGTNEVNTLEMASAFGTIANGGVHVHPVAVTKITDADGNVLYSADRNEPKPKQAVDPNVTSTAVKLLEGVIRGGTGTAANIGRPQIGKTGTAQNYSDAWFVGAVPQLSAAVWVGYPKAQKSLCCTRIGTVYGGTWPAQIWRNFMSKATRGMPKEHFPKGGQKYVTVEVDVTRNCLPNTYTPPGLIDRVTYVKGREPTKKCKQPTDYGVEIVPNVVGLSNKRAELELNRVGFEAKIEKADLGKPFEVVGAQDPLPGTELSTSEPVVITISKKGYMEKDSGSGSKNQGKNEPAGRARQTGSP